MISDRSFWRAFVCLSGCISINISSIYLLFKTLGTWEWVVSGICCGMSLAGTILLIIFIFLDWFEEYNSSDPEDEDEDNGDGDDNEEFIDKFITSPNDSVHVGFSVRGIDN